MEFVWTHFKLFYELHSIDSVNLELDTLLLWCTQTLQYFILKEISTSHQLVF